MSSDDELEFSSSHFAGLEERREAEHRRRQRASEDEARVGGDAVPRVAKKQSSFLFFFSTAQLAPRKSGPPKKTASNARKNEARQLFRSDESCPDGMLVCLICEPNGKWRKQAFMHEILRWLRNGGLEILEKYEKKNF